MLLRWVSQTHKVTSSSDLLCLIISTWHATYPQNTPIYKLITLVCIPLGMASGWPCICMSTSHCVCVSTEMHTKYFHKDGSVSVCGQNDIAVCVLHYIDMLLKCLKLNYFVIFSQVYGLVETLIPCSVISNWAALKIHQLIIINSIDTEQSLRVWNVFPMQRCPKPALLLMVGRRATLLVLHRSPTACKLIQGWP